MQYNLKQAFKLNVWINIVILSQNKVFINAQDRSSDLIFIYNEIVDIPRIEKFSDCYLAKPFVPENLKYT
jgi:hypothetical protein